MPLPNFLVIGAAKAGTTSLYQYLRQHPEVYMPATKEARYARFEGPSDPARQVHTAAAYAQLFDGAALERAIGEASPQYLNSAAGPERIDEELPGVKLIVSLRDPVDRAYSSYLGRLRGGSERCSVEEAMRPGSYYFETSLYFPRLSRYLARFGEERIKVILFDDLEEDASGVLHELFEFLGVDPAFAPDVSVRHNSARVPRSIALNELLLRTAAAFHRAAPRLRGSGLISRAQELLLRRAGPLDPAIRRRLRAQFRDDTLRTAQLIGRDLSRWLEKD